jgi:hypothetical protein
MDRRTLIIGVFVIFILAALSYWYFAARDQQLPAVPRGDQELAWFHTATNYSSWERFVTGVNRVSRAWPELRVDDSKAFPEATTATPELALTLSGQPGRILIRWYKFTKGVSAADWMARLGQRSPPPLVVIGGGSSDRALDLARAMAGQKSWRGSPPLLFITTATASTITDANELIPVELMKIYPDRSFRMAFTNDQIAQAIVDFVWSQPELRPHGDPTPTLATIGFASDENPLTPVAMLPVQAELGAPSVTGLEWDDDPYSIDLSNQFHRVLHEPKWGPVIVRERRSIPFSIGGQFTPNKWEAQAADHLLSGLTVSPLERQLLVLPTLAAPARRVLRTITGALPLVGRNLVAITGDSINLNNVYRDADIGWNARSIPIPLVFFAQQNPVGWDIPAIDEDRLWPAGQSTGPPVPAADLPHNHQTILTPPTNTDEVLLHRDMIRIICQSAFGGGVNPPGLISDSEELRRRLRALQPPVFDAVGDRQVGQGEYVVWLRPQFFEPGHPAFSQVLSTATLEVWTRTGANWRPVKRLILDHGRTTTSRF